MSCWKLGLIIKAVRCFNFIVYLGLKNCILLILFCNFVCVCFDCLCHLLKLGFSFFNFYSNLINILLNFFFISCKTFNMLSLQLFFWFVRVRFQLETTCISTRTFTCTSTVNFSFKSGLPCNFLRFSFFVNLISVKWFQNWGFIYSCFPIIIRI